MQKRFIRLKLKANIAMKFLLLSVIVSLSTSISIDQHANTSHPHVKQVAHNTPSNVHKSDNNPKEKLPALKHISLFKKHHRYPEEDWSEDSEDFSDKFDKINSWKKKVDKFSAQKNKSQTENDRWPADKKPAHFHLNEAVTFKQKIKKIDRNSKRKNRCSENASKSAKKKTHKDEEQVKKSSDKPDSHSAKHEKEIFLVGNSLVESINHKSVDPKNHNLKEHESQKGLTHSENKTAHKDSTSNSLLSHGHTQSNPSEGNGSPKHHGLSSANKEIIPIIVSHPEKPLAKHDAIKAELITEKPQHPSNVSHVTTSQVDTRVAQTLNDPKDHKHSHEAQNVYELHKHGIQAPQTIEHHKNVIESPKTTESHKNIVEAPKQVNNHHSSDSLPKNDNTSSLNHHFSNTPPIHIDTTSETPKSQPATGHATHPTTLSPNNPSYKHSLLIGGRPVGLAAASPQQSSNGFKNSSGYTFKF